MHCAKLWGYRDEEDTVLLSRSSHSKGRQTSFQQLSSSTVNVMIQVFMEYCGITKQSSNSAWEKLRTKAVDNREALVEWTGRVGMGRTFHAEQTARAKVLRWTAAWCTGNGE